MPRRLVAVIALAALLPGCMAGLCTSDYANSCSSTTPDVHHHYHEDDDDTGTVLLGAALGTAALAAVLLIARSGNDADDAPRVAPAPVYIVRGEAPTDADAMRLERMFMQAHMSARAGRCEAARAITKRVLETAPEHYDRYAADAAIARCLD